MAKTNKTRSKAFIDDPLWYKDAVVYQTHVRAFCDTDGDGIGDLRGLLDKLPYLEDLGITCTSLEIQTVSRDQASGILTTGQPVADGDNRP